MWNTCLAVFPTRVAGLAGGDTVAVACQVATGANFAATANTLATIIGTGLWVR